MTTPSIRDNYLCGLISREEALTELMQINGGQWAEAGRMIDSWGVSYVAHFDKAGA